MAVWRLPLPVLLSLLLLPSATSQAPTKELAGHVLPWASRENMVARAASSEAIKILVHVGYSNSAAVERLAESISDPRSSEYRKYLTRSQFNARFAASPTFVARVSSWLQSQGFTIAHVALNRLYISAEGTVGVAERAFSVQLGMFRVGKHILRASLNNPSIPLSLSQGENTISILGLDQAGALRNPGRVKRRPGWSQGSSGQGSSGGGRLGLERLRPQGEPTAPHVEAVYTGCVWKDESSYGACSPSPSQIRAAYGVPKHLTGKKQSIGFVLWAADPFLQSDLDKFSKRNGLKHTTVTTLTPPFNTTLSQILKNPDLTPVAGDDNSEYSLDVQIAHGIAPDAKLIYAMAESSQHSDILPAVNVFLDFDLAPVVSNSWASALYGPSGSLSRSGAESYSGGAAFVAAFEALFKQAVIIGVGMYFASGDDGTGEYSSSLGYYVTPTYPASSPWVTAVGGTALAMSKAAQPVLFEAPWGKMYEFQGATNQPNYTYYPGDGAGGGIANTFKTPFYQALFKETKRVLHKSKFSKGRLSPDIAALGDPLTGLLIWTTNYVDAKLTKTLTEEVPAGGTSLATPLIAALVACAAQDAMGQPPFGFLAPTLYSLKASAFRDITNRRMEVALLVDPAVQQATGFQEELLIGGVRKGLFALPGYDLSTGRGSPSYTFISQLVSFYAKRGA